MISNQKKQLLSEDGGLHPMTSLGRWLEGRRKFCDMHVEEILWPQSKEWVFDRHCFRHCSGGFFRIVGATVYRDGKQQPHLEQPLIDQPEVGILGFIVRRSGLEVKILVQAKPEPGNIGFVLAAPSVQATVSNYTRRHQGKETLFLEYFLGTRKDTIISDSLQSEQGTRFLGKYNRNMIVEVPSEASIPESTDHKWIRVQELYSLLIQDFQINSDARSVLACGPWHKLSPNYEPFERWRDEGGVGEALLSSYEASEKECALSTKEIIDRLDRCQKTANFATAVVSLTDLAQWEMTERALRSINKSSFEVRQMEVVTSEREVNQWDQPLVTSGEEGQVILFAQKKNGILHFLFNCRAEIGFRERCQYGPTIQDLSCDSFILPALHKQACELKGHLGRSKHLFSILQSDEGGRFYQCVSRYSIRLLDKDEVIGTDQNLSWVNLHQIELLAKRPGFFSNEARTMISILLAYL
jgi:oxidase EvaA